MMLSTTTTTTTTMSRLEIARLHHRPPPPPPRQHVIQQRAILRMIMMLMLSTTTTMSRPTIPPFPTMAFCSCLLLLLLLLELLEEMILTIATTTLAIIQQVQGTRNKFPIVVPFAWANIVSEIPSFGAATPNVNMPFTTNAFWSGSSKCNRRLRVLVVDRNLPILKKSVKNGKSSGRARMRSIFARLVCNIVIDYYYNCNHHILYMMRCMHACMRGTDQSNPSTEMNGLIHTTGIGCCCIPTQTPSTPVSLRITADTDTHTPRHAY
jgi:hypothetical protein